MLTDRLLFKIDDADTGMDSLEAVKSNAGLTITIEEPWAGDTETGFGRSSSLRITNRQARNFADWILQHCESE